MKIDDAMVYLSLLRKLLTANKSYSWPGWFCKRELRNGKAKILAF